MKGAPVLSLLQAFTLALERSPWTYRNRGKLGPQLDCCALPGYRQPQYGSQACWITRPSWLDSVKRSDCDQLPQASVSAVDFTGRAALHWATAQGWQVHRIAWAGP